MVKERISRPPKGPVQGPPLLFVHGACHGAWCWDDHFLDYFAEQGYPTHAFSLRGHGGDDRGWRLRFYRTGQYLADLRGEIERLTEAPILIGHSIGARLVQMHAARQGARGVVLLAPPPPGGLGGSVLRLFGRLPGPMLLNHLLLTWKFLSKDPRWAQAIFFRRDLASADLARHFRRLGDEAAMAYGQMLFPLLPRDRSLRCPAFVLAGDQDAIFTVPEVRATAALLNARLEILPGLAHDLMIDPQWERVAAAILDWLKAANP